MVNGLSGVVGAALWSLQDAQTRLNGSLQRLAEGDLDTLVEDWSALSLAKVQVGVGVAVLREALDAQGSVLDLLV